MSSVSSVYKAYNYNGRGYIVCFNKVPLEKRVQVLKGETSVSNEDLLVVELKNEIDNIPDNFIISETLFQGVKLSHVRNSEVIEKCLNPYKVFEVRDRISDTIWVDVGNWVMVDNIPMCQVPYHYGEGTWFTGNDVVISYVKEKPVLVAREGFVRFHKTYETDILSINTSTRLCTYSCKKFKGRNEITRKYVFDFDIRSWVLTDEQIKNDIIGVKVIQ